MPDTHQQPYVQSSCTTECSAIVGCSLHEGVVWGCGLFWTLLFPMSKSMLGQCMHAHHQAREGGREGGREGVRVREGE